MNIAIVNDLDIEIYALEKFIQHNTNYNIIWTAKNGQEAIEKNNQSKADLILMNLNMPVLDGLEATKQIMKSNPTPIIIITSSAENFKNKVFEALGEGVLDISSVPIFSKNKFEDKGELLKKIKTVKKLLGNKSNDDIHKVKSKKIDFKLVLIGTSTGGPKAISQILQKLPSKINGSLIIIQHLDKSFSKELVEWLSRFSQINLQIPKSSNNIEKGKIYIVTGDEHLSLIDNKFYYSKEPKNLHYKPSIDKFFESISNYDILKGVAIILTGMGNDGTKGLISLKKKGWITIAQDEYTSTVFGMPKSAIESTAVTYILGINEISDYIAKFLKE